MEAAQQRQHQILLHSSVEYVTKCRVHHSPVLCIKFDLFCLSLPLLPVNNAKHERSLASYLLYRLGLDARLVYSNLTSSQI